MSERKRDDLAGFAEAVQQLLRAQQGVAATFAESAARLGGVGTEVGELIAQAAAQLSVPKDAAGRPDVVETMRRVHDHLGQASEIFRKAQEIFVQAIKTTSERPESGSQTAPPRDESTKP